MIITSRPFGVTRDGHEVTLYHMENKRGAYIDLLDWGARIQAIGVPDKNGTIVDVCLGFDDMEGYEAHADTYMGAAIGRNANRIKNACFKLNNIVYQMDANEGSNQCHGGIRGFDSRMWSCVMQEHLISFYRDSPHMEEGYPGLMRVTINYELTSTDDVVITYTAMSEEDTLVNLTNHAYFNLAGSGSIYGHTLQVASSRITPVDEELIPTGEIAPVEGTAYDLRTPTLLDGPLHDMPPMMQAANGYDVNYILDGAGLRTVAVLACPETGIRMTCRTDMPCMQVYSGNYLHAVGKGGAPYEKHSAICLETQRYPNAANCPGFPSVVLHAREIFRSRTVYAFDLLPQ